MWREAALGEVVTLQRGFDLPEDQRRPGYVPVVSSAGISGYNVSAKAKGPGVVTGRYGTLGKVYFVRDDFWPHNTTLFAKDFHGNDERFVYYLLTSLNLASHSAVSAVPGVNRNDLHRVPVLLPPLPIQRRIAEILGRLDDKIEVNRRINRTLEAMAQALYKHWFVDFGPFQDGEFVESAVGLIPRGWEVKALDEIATYTNGLALQKYPPKGDEYLPVIKIAEMRRGVTDTSDKASPDIDARYIVRDGDVLFSWSGTLLVSLWCGGPGALNQHLFKVTSTQYPKWLYYWATKHHLDEFKQIAANKVTTMGHIQRHHLAEALVAIPPRLEFQQIDRTMSVILDKIIECELESRQLAATRDYLLPRLLAGEVEV